MQVQWSGLISPIPGYTPDNSDQWTQYFINLIHSSLPPAFSSVSIVVDPLDPTTGTHDLHVYANYSGAADPQIVLTNAVSGAGTNLDIGSVQFSQQGSISSDLPVSTPMQPATVVPEPTPVVPVAVLPTPVTPVLPPVTQTVPVSTPVVPVVATPVPTTATLPAVTQTTAAAAKPAISPALVVVGIIALLFLSSGK